MLYDEFIKIRKEILNTSQEKLAGILEKSRNTIILYEKGIQRIPSNIVMSMRFLKMKKEINKINSN